MRSGGRGIGSFATGRVQNLAAVLAVSALALSAIACGSSSPEPDAAPVSGSSSASGVEAGSPTATPPDCTEPVRAGIALDPAALSCADSGFDVQSDVFSFANWGSYGALGAGDAISYFGADAVCAEAKGTECTMFPAAKAWLDQINAAMMGGRCEGMAVLSGRLADGGSSVAALQEGAVVTFDLSKQTTPVVNQIESLWATQLMPEVADPTGASRALQPSEVAATLIEGLRQDSGYTLGMYFEGAGHAVTPIAVSQANGVYDVAIYDSNAPETVSHLLIDPVAQTWVYLGTDAEQSASSWQGTGPGSLDVTAMQWRTGPFSAPFGQNSPDAKRTILVTADVPLGAGNVAVEVELDGRMLDTATDSPTAIEAALPESRVTLIRAGRTVVGVQIQVPQASPALRITPYLQPKDTGATSTLPVETQISVDGPNQPRVTAVTLLDSAASGASVTAQPDGAVLVQAGTQSSVEVLVANGRRSFAAPVPPGGTANVSPTSEGVAGIELSAQGVQDFEYQIKAGKSGDDVTTTSAVLKSGRWRVLGKSTQAVTQVAPKPTPTAESLPPSTVATASAGNPTASQTSVAPTESAGPTTSSAASASPSTTVTTKPSASVKPTTNTKPTKSPKPTASTKPSSSTYPTTAPQPTPTYTIVPVPTQPTVVPSVPVIPPSVTPQPTPTPTPTPTTKPSVTESPTAKPVPTFSVVIPKPTITFQLP